MCVTSGTATWPVRGCVRPGSGTTPSAPRLVTARPGMSAARTSADVPCWSCGKHRRERDPGHRIPEEARGTARKRKGRQGHASAEFRRGRSKRAGKERANQRPADGPSLSDTGHAVRPTSACPPSSLPVRELPPGGQQRWAARRGGRRVVPGHRGGAAGGPSFPSDTKG